MSRSASFALVLATLSTIGCGADGPGAGPDAAVAAGALSPAERDALVFTREEEKLARDVYDALDGNGGPFVNIQTSEQQHMDAILVLLDRYRLPDPAATTAIGEFVNPTLRGLYPALVSQGQPSATAALTVGCLIEELDIRDLELAKVDASHADLDATYDALLLGSRNHLRAFYGRLVDGGGSYTPVYIDQATFDAIVSSPQERP